MFKSRRKGFTLAEVLVTIAIVAIIAAAVVPAVTSQIAKGEETTVISAVGSLRTTLTAFMSDVRTFPNRVSHLTNAITTTDSAITNTQYTAAQVARWKGPYTTTSTLAAADSLGIGAPDGIALFMRTLIKDSSNFVVVTIAPVYTHSQALGLELLFEATSDSTGGTVRWRGKDANDSIPGRSVKLYLTSSR
jgi:prepilin-type N-terminal cleavage/methylation domain-containing protein